MHGQKRNGEFENWAGRKSERSRLARCGAVAALLAATLVATSPAAHAAPAPAPAAHPATAWPGGRWEPDPVQYGMTVVSDVPVTMDDGVILHANIGYPTNQTTGERAPGTFPVLLTQNPYVGASQQPDPFYVQRGYIFVSVEVRGTLNSEAPGDGPLVNELFSRRQAQDGVELVDWVAHHLSGSNGVVGLTGCSQLGINQLFTAAAVGPHSPVKAIVPACASNGYGIYFAGGIPGPTLGLFGAPGSGALSGQKHAPENEAFGAALKQEVLAGGPRAYNGAFWQERTTSPSIAAQIVRNGIPALLWSGWGAPDGTGALELYAALQNSWAHRSPDAPMSSHAPVTGRYQVVIGPWGHGQGLDKSIQLEWYDTWLKGTHTGIDRTRTPMHLFDTGAQAWVNAATYPLDTSYTPYRLAADGALLSQAASHEASSSDTIAWGQPTDAGTTLSYTTAPLSGALTVAGPISVSVYASSSTPNLELIATLYDVAPGGTRTALTSGALIGSMRALDPRTSWYDAHGVLARPVHPYAADSYVSPGRIARYDITLNPTVHSLPAGHALAVTLSTQEPTANCVSLLSALAPAIPCLLTAPQQATLPGGVYEIFHSTRYPSALNLPTLAADYLPVAASGITPTSGSYVEPLDWSSPPPASAEPTRVTALPTLSRRKPSSSAR